MITETKNIPKEFQNPMQLLCELQTMPESHWLKRGEDRALKLFHQMAERVPAYKDFLHKNGVDPEKVSSAEYLHEVPAISKENYIKAYPLKALCWDGSLSKGQWTFSATSGSTGEPTYFPRENDQDVQYAITAELYLLNNFEIHRRSTLYINGFAMGVWIGGLFTYQAIKMIADRGGHALSIIAPGINKAEILRAVRNLGGEFEQIIIGGYPPFIKEVIDDGIDEGLNWSDYNIKFIFSAEGFSERFRDYIYEKAGLRNIYLDTLNHYGTVDLGTMSHETPLSILLRRRALENPDVYESVFAGISKIPTLTQYLPEMFFFEEDGGNLFCSAYSGLPLVRYDLKDHGGVRTLADMARCFAEAGIDIFEEAGRAGISRHILNLPFVYVYERSDLSVTIVGLNVYPESVRHALQRKDLEDLLTGKFTMLTEFDGQHNQYLAINLELKRGIKQSESLKKLVLDAVVHTLRNENSEYRSLYDHMPQKASPQLRFWPYEHPAHFGSGGKHKWVKQPQHEAVRNI
jgi:phenylacetate-CoA ligase